MVYLDIVSDIFSTLGSIAEGFANLLTSIFEAVAGIIYVPASGSGADAVAAHLTVVGVLMLIGLASALVIWGFNFVRRLIRLRTK